MYISSRSWHARVYRWWKEMKYGENQWRAPSQVNLCPYVRAVLFWSWSRYLMLSGKIEFGKRAYGEPRFTLRIPYLFWGAQPLLLLYTEYLIFGKRVFMSTLQILGAALGILSLVSVAGLIVYVIYRIAKMKPVQNTLDEAADGAVSFGRVVKERIRAEHHKICPIVEFREE